MINRSTLNQRLSKTIHSLSFYIALFSCVCVVRFLFKSLLQLPNQLYTFLPLQFILNHLLYLGVRNSLGSETDFKKPDTMT